MSDCCRGLGLDRAVGWREWEVVGLWMCVKSVLISPSSYRGRRLIEPGLEARPV